MFRMIALLFAVLFPFAASAAGGGSPPPPPWNPSNQIKILYAYNIEMQVQERVCWKRYVDWRYCKKTPSQHAQEQADYLNWLFEKSQINLKAVGVGTGMTTNIRHHEVQQTWARNMLNGMRQQAGADLVMVVNSHALNGRIAGACGTGNPVCWYADYPFSLIGNPFESPRQAMAHEVGHWFGLAHHEGLPASKPYAVGHGTWGFVDVMHYTGDRGKGFLKMDVYSDHELKCSFWACGIYGTNSAARYLRERYGRYVRPSAPGGGNKNNGGGHGGHGRH